MAKKAQTTTTGAIDLIITRHPTLVEYLVAEGFVSPDTPVIEHVTPEDVRGRNVIGVVPFHLGALCKSVTEVPLALTPEMRKAGELTIEQIREIAGPPVTYHVQRLRGFEEAEEAEEAD